MILYKYRSYEKDSSAKQRTIGILKKKELFFSGIEAFNDPFDGRVHLRYDGKINEIKSAQVRVQYAMKLTKDKKEGITMLQALNLIDERFTQKYIEEETFNKERLKRVQKLHNRKGVLALSSKNDNILMWSHYSNNHYGVCFGFECTDGIYNNHKKVRYQTHYDDIWSWLHTDDEIVDRILFSKSIDWQYEDEYRIIKSEIGCEKIPENSLKEIIFGCKMAKEDKLEIIEFCNTNNISTSFKEAKLDVESYKLNIVDYK
jgi:hypothetical protein